MKKLFKSICSKVYSIGYYEMERIRSEKRKQYLQRVATVHDTAWISNLAELVNKSLPKQHILVGKHSRIMGDLLLFDHGGEIKIGEYCFVGPNTRIWSAESISIGNRVLISHNVNIHDNNSHPIDPEERHHDFVSFYTTGYHQAANLAAEAIVIEDDVWIGFNAIIGKGVRVGRGSIIGAGSVVLKDVEPYTINVGNPLRCVRSIKTSINDK